MDSSVHVGQALGHLPCLAPHTQTTDGQSLIDSLNNTRLDKEFIGERAMKCCLC